MDVVMSAESTPHSELRSYIERGANRKYLAEFDSLVEQLEAAERVAREAFQFDARFEERLHEMARPLNDAITAWRASSPARRPDG